MTEEEEKQMRELFDEYDTDGSGEISRDELYEIVERVIGSHTSAMHIVDVSLIPEPFPANFRLISLGN